MKRNIINKLILWKKDKKHKPILLTGVKGVGKTYLAYDFSKAFFDHVIYINFENKTNNQNVFEISEHIKLKDRLMEINSNRNYGKTKKKPNLNKSILILDEVPINNSTLEKISLLHKTDVFPYIMLITSNSTIVESFNELKNFNHIPIYSLGFDEFLKAINHDWYIETIKTHYENNNKVPTILHEELLELHQLYLQVGGMPDVLNEYISFSNTINLSEKHNMLLGSYYSYINESSMTNQSLKMKQVLDSIPQQLEKKNKKFQYRLIRKGTTYAMYKKAIYNLTEGRYSLRCNKITAKDILESKSGQLSSSSNSFKLYMADVGFLYTGFTQYGINCGKPDIQKALLENYIAQTFNTKGYPLYFWESQSMAKIEFIIKKDNNIIPVEVYNDTNTRSKSISVLKQTLDFPYAIKISSKNFEFSNEIKYVPHYAAFCI